MNIEVIETERLYLRGFQKSDAWFAISIWNAPEPDIRIQGYV